MRFLCLDVPAPSATMEQYLPHIHDEVRHGWKLYKSGVVRDIYFRQDRPGVVIFAEANSAEEAKAALMEFPLAQEGLIGWDVVPLGPFVNWEFLFAPGNA